MRLFAYLAVASSVLQQSAEAFQAVAVSRDVTVKSHFPLNKPSTTQFPRPAQKIRTQLFSTTTENQDDEIDVDALVKYGVAGLVQMAGFSLVLAAFDKGVESTGFQPPLWLNGLFFYACSLKSRVLNPLSNERPKVGSPVGTEIARPSWFPPGVIFPIMWILIIGPIRAYSSALVYDATGEFLNVATLSFLLHLTVGDVWNTINNVEKRLGAAASGVVFVILSAANASYQYYQVDATAGKLLGLTLLWLCTAGALVASIWQLNPDQITGLKDAPFPAKGEIETRFAWFNKKE
jgi:benzodiazapine receptor